MHNLNIDGRADQYSRHRPKGLTFAICTHNGAERLARTLECLAAQQDTTKFAWEVLLVDNASVDGTAELTRQIWPNRFRSRLRIVREPSLGVANARLRALKECQYSILSFIDDDNWVSPNWMREVLEIFDRYPSVGMVHASSVAHLAVEPPPFFGLIKGWLAIGSACEEVGVVFQRPVSFWTAGLSFRLEALEFLDQPEYSLTLVGRTGERPLGGEDHELSLCLALSGWDIFATRDIHFQHDIPETRLTVDYIERLIEHSSTARRILDIYRYEFRSSGIGVKKPTLTRYVFSFVSRATALALKKIIDRSDLSRLPNLLSYRMAKGALRGFPQSTVKLKQVRENILACQRLAELRQHIGPPG